MNFILKFARSFAVYLYKGFKLILHSHDRVMFRPPYDPLPSNKRPLMNHQTYLLVKELSEANSSKAAYEECQQLPLEDFFYVGGKIQALIRKAHRHLATSQFDSFDDRANVQARLDELKDFRDYIIKRIKRGNV